MSTYDQQQADIGDDIGEREVMDVYEVGDADHDINDPAPWTALSDLVTLEPDESALVGEILTQVGYAVDDLATPDNVAVLIDSSRDELAHIIHDLDHQLLLLGTVRDEAAQALAALMEDDTESIAGLAVTRSRSDKVEWDKDGTWRAAKFSIVERWGTPEHVDRVMADIETAFAITPRVTGLKAIGVNPHEYRAVTRGTHYRVAVK